MGRTREDVTVSVCDAIARIGTRAKRQAAGGLNPPVGIRDQGEWVHDLIQRFAEAKSEPAIEFDGRRILGRYFEPAESETTGTKRVQRLEHHLLREAAGALGAREQHATHTVLGELPQNAVPTHDAALERHVLDDS